MMVKLVPMNELEFEMYVQYSIQEYAQEQEKSGRESEDEGVHEAEQQYQQLLPQGLQTPNHTLCMIVDEERDRSVGVLWFDLHAQENERQVNINDIVIFEEFRRRGYAKRAIQLLEKQAIELGATSVVLRTLEPNESMRILYERLKHMVASMSMSKSL